MDDENGVEFQLELVATDDPKTLILVCRSNVALKPKEYAQALIFYADQILNSNKNSNNSLN